MYYLYKLIDGMNIVKEILKNKHLQIIADDSDIVNNQKLKNLVKINSKLLAQNRIKKKDKVVIVISNSTDFVVSFLSTINVCVSAPLNPNYTIAEFEFYFEDLKPEFIISNFDDSHSAIICAKKHHIKIINVNKSTFTIEAKEKFKKVKKVTSIKENDTALILHTSGTTSRPKMVPLTHGNLYYSSINIGRALKLSKNDRNII